MTAVLAIASALLVGGADFIGGFLSRSSSPVRVAALAQAIGLALAIPAALVVDVERVTGADAAWSAASGAAVGLGLVHEVADDLDAALERILGELRTAGPRAARHAKRLVLERPDGPETARRIAERRTSDEGQEGLRAFLDRRTAAWAPARRDAEP